MSADPSIVFPDRSLLLLGVLVLIAAVLLLALLRNSCVFYVRIHFIHAADFPASFERLPEYDVMLFHPRHWLRWSVAQWSDWMKP